MPEEFCDCCGPAVKAWVWVEIGERELTFCGHHATKWWDSIVAVSGGRVHDYRYMILETR